MLRKNSSNPSGASHFLSFVFVGLSGLLVNSMVLALATTELGIFYLNSVVIASICSTTWNFCLTELGVYRDRRRHRGVWKRFAIFLVLNQAALLVRAPIVLLLTSGLGVHYLLSNLLSLALVTLVRFAIADLGIWARQDGAGAHVFHYNLHGVITIASDVGLPELELFRTEEIYATPTVRVLVGKTGDTPSSMDAPVRCFQYDEGLGPVGFRAQLRIGNQIEVRTSPVLRLSPHVLYTNVIEPILRWAFVTKGFALVHGACVAVGENAYLITARTDTGKTTTILQILAQHASASFVSDDLTLLSPDGCVFTYPKPLTISSHTVRAVNIRSLSFLERLTMPLQSRIHSRSGRRLAHWLTRMPLPMATINTFVQWLVPPPKYFVQQLVPGVRQTQSAPLRGIFVIERGDSAVVHLEPDVALATRVQNSEDAYGFPPYPAMASFLSHLSGRDLRPIETAIVGQAAAAIPTIRIGSHSGWRQPIMDRIDSLQ